MVFFPNEQLEIFEYTETKELDSYLEPKKEYQYVTTVPCDFQVMTPTDSLKEYGEILEDTYKIYIDINTEITPSMIFRLQGKQATYQITGTPIHNNHLSTVQHKKILVQKQRKPTKVIKND